MQAQSDIRKATETSPLVGEHALGVATFAFPCTISAVHPQRASNEVRHLLARALALCQPFAPSSPFYSIGDAKLSALAAQCIALSGAGTSSIECASMLTDDEACFDHFFGISRSTSHDAFALGIVWGLLAMLYEVGRPHSLTPTELAALVSGFYLLAEAFPLPTTSEDGVVPANADGGGLPSPVQSIVGETGT